MKTIQLLLIAITISSCASYTQKEYRIERKLECPQGYLYNLNDGMCYYYNPPRPELPKILDTKVIIKPVPKKRSRKENLPCSEIFEQVNTCYLGGK